MSNNLVAREQPGSDSIENYRQFTMELLIAEDAAQKRTAKTARALRQAECDLTALGVLLEAASMEIRARGTLLEEASAEIRQIKLERDTLQKRVETLAAISRFSVWLSARRTLIGLLRRSSDQATLALESAMHRYQVPRDVDWLRNKRVLLGLLRRSLLDGPETAQGMVFTRMARELLRATQG
jgi:hypothetical protein